MSGEIFKPKSALEVLHSDEKPHGRTSQTPPFYVAQQPKSDENFPSSSSSPLKIVLNKLSYYDNERSKGGSQFSLRFYSGSAR
jgi:hypothetical protein